MEEFARNEKWLFTEEELQNTPSVRAGIPLEQELTFRQKQAMLIQTIGLKSGLTQLAVNTSVIFMHRFFMYRTVKCFPRVQLALGFAFAGGKVEESARKLEHLIRMAVEVIRHNRNKEFLDKSDALTHDMDLKWKPTMEALFQNNCSIESAAYVEMRKQVLECETEIYGVIGFQLQIVHPHNYVIRMCALLGAENIKDISQYAYNLATASSQLTMLCLKYTPETIATMCLNIASKAHSVRFESMKDSNVKWYQVIVPNTEFSEIEAVSEEFLHLIKGCPLLPSWMTNLARMSRVNNRMPGPSRGPGTSSVSAPGGVRQGVPSSAASSSTATTSASTSSQPSSSLPQSHPSRPQTVATTSQGQLINSGRGPGLQGEAVISPSNKQVLAEVGGSGIPTGLDVHSSHSKPHRSSDSSQMRPPQVSTGASVTAQHHHHHQQIHQHRTHPPGNGRPTIQGAPPTDPSGRSIPKVPLQSGSTNPQATRPSQHSGPSVPSHSTSHQSFPRPAHEQVRPQESANAHDHSRSYSDALKTSHESTRLLEGSRHLHPRPDRRRDPNMDTNRVMPQTLEPMSNRSHRPDQPYNQRTGEQSPHTPPTSPPSGKYSSPPEPAPDLPHFIQASGDAPDPNIPTTQPDNLPISQSSLELHKLQALPVQGSKLSLNMYRERASAKSRTPVEQSTSGEEANISAMDESFALGPNSESTTDSPVGVSFRHSSSADLANFNKPQDSPNNPRIKIKVKRDPSSGERHAVKYANSGLKIKIKPLRSETSGGPDGDAGPSVVGLTSTSSTPREEGEIIDDTPPSSGDTEQKSERLKIRLSVPKSDHGSSYSRREHDQGSNGYSGDRESSHRSHHHGHHRSHHHSKSKKHSKHDRSRHEGKSSKRSSSSVDYYDERPSKNSRIDTHSASSGDVSHRLSTYSDFSTSNSSSRALQQQNSGFSINDAFSSTMPHNIFDDDDDPGHVHPPITPTADAVPPHHEKFHQIIAQHRAASLKPPLPKGPPPSQTSPPPPPPPTPPNF